MTNSGNATLDTPTTDSQPTPAFIVTKPSYRCQNCAAVISKPGHKCPQRKAEMRCW